MRGSLLIAVMALGVTCGAACGGGPTGQMTVHTTGADVSTLSSHRTYTHETAANAPEGYSSRPLPPEFLDKTQREVDGEMAKRGYTRDENGELVVRISTGVRKVEEEPTGRMAKAGA